MTGWMIYPRYTSLHSDNAFDWLTQEADRVGITLEIRFTEDFGVIYGNGGSMSHNELTYKNVNVSGYPDFVVIRDYRAALSRHFEQQGIRVINAWQPMMLCRDKLLTHQLLAGAGIPTPLTYHCESDEYSYRELCLMFDSDRFVVKKRDGAKGENVYLVSNDAELRQAVESCRGHVVCQQFIENSSGRDVRVWTIGGKAVAAVMRYSAMSFMSNFSQGGSATPFELTPEAIRLAETASNLLGLEFAGVDLLFGPDGLMVNEINGNAGFRTLSQTGENNIPRLLFAYIRDTLTF